MVYHVFNKSIANFVVFNNDFEFSRIIELACYYQIEKPIVSFSRFIKAKRDKIMENPIYLNNGNKLVEIIAYCFMPAHFHLILKQVKEKSISLFINNILNSYTRYFNIIHNRKGPLWESRSKKVLVETDEQLLHLTRYVHLNPVTAYLVNRPEEWSYSSYMEYLSKSKKGKKICNYEDFLEIEPTSYKEFVEDRIAYQRELAKIKDLLLDD